MALAVEVSGFGVVASPSYSMFVVCVQQENYQAWTVYRRYASFLELNDQMQNLYPGTAVVPRIDGDSMNLDTLSQCRSHLDKWLRGIIVNPMVLRTQSMYQFLCADANISPPNVVIHWRSSENGSFDEMDMEDMFDRQEAEDGQNDVEFDEDRDARNSSSGQPSHVFSGAAGGGNSRNGMIASQVDDQMDDGLDIQSLSLVEAEFIYDDQMIDQEERPATVNLESFDIKKVIGKGSFGKVFLVREKATNTTYAMKVLKKDYIIRKNQVEHTKTERSVLGMVKHPHIVGLHKAFQTADKLFFVLDYCAGGELFFHLGKVGRFPEERARFYAAQITLALEYVHSLDIIYRDLKPENVLLDHMGNIRLTDFGLSKEGVTNSSSGANSFCGTPEYIAPEVLQRQGHGRAVDWWSLGALLFEMITGLPPFYSRNRETMFEKIMRAELTFPTFMSEPAKDILSKLLVRDPKFRLGSSDRDALELKEHPFFFGLDWVSLLKSEMPAPWVPAVVGSLDTSQFDQEFTAMLPLVSPDMREAYFGSLDKAFEGFTFVDESAMGLMSSNAVQRSSFGGAAQMSSSLPRAGAGATMLATSLKKSSHGPFNSNR